MTDECKHADQNERNVAVVLRAKEDLGVQDFPMPAPLRRGDVRVKVKALGICGSDVHYWTHGSIGPFVLKAPMVIGHESAGVVVAVGDGVDNLSVGDEVALEPGVPCGGCRECCHGQYNLCPDVEFFATPPVHGSFARYINHPAKYCFKLPAGVSLEQGAMVEPMSVGVHACRRAGVSAGHTVLVLGAGPIGLVSLLVAKAFGATQVVVTDVAEARLEMAKRLGATPVNVGKMSPSESAAAIRKACGAADVTIDACGFSSAFQTGIMSTAPGGTMCMVGMGQETVGLPLAEATVREINLVGIFRYRDTYPTCLKLMGLGRLDVTPLITHRFGCTPADVAAGFALARSGGRDTGELVIKVMFNITDEGWDACPAAGPHSRL